MSLGEGGGFLGPSHVQTLRRNCLSLELVSKDQYP